MSQRFRSVYLYYVWSHLVQSINGLLTGVGVMKVDELIRTLTLGKNSSDCGIKTFYHITAKQILCNILQVNMRQDSVSPSYPKLIQSCVEAVSKVSQNFLSVVHAVP